MPKKTYTFRTQRDMFFAEPCFDNGDFNEVIQGLDTSVSSILKGLSTDEGTMRNASYHENELLNIFADEIGVTEFEAQYIRDFYDETRTPNTEPTTQPQESPTSEVAPSAE